MRRSSLVVAFVAALLGALGGTLVGTAQEATPAGQAAQPIVPAPNQCTVAPRDIAFYEQLAGTPGAATPATAFPAAATPLGVGLEGEPADRATRGAVLDTVRQVLACINAGNTLALQALLTDAYVTSEWAASGGLTAEDLAGLAAEPVPLDGDRAALLAILDVRVLADGRVTVLVDVFDPTASPPSPVRYLYTMVEQDGRFLIDEAVWAPIDESQIGVPAT